MTVIIDGSASADFHTPLPVAEGGTAGQGACLIQEGANNAWIAAEAEL